MREVGGDKELVLVEKASFIHNVGFVNPYPRKKERTPPCHLGIRRTLS
jgi:hypothetical protein